MTARKELLSARDESGWSALAVTAYNGDAEATGLLLDAGARVPPGEITVYMGDDPAPVGSLVELVVRRSAMFIMLGTGFLPPSYLRGALKNLVTSRAPFPGDAEVPDLARTLEMLLARGGARPTEKSSEEGSDLSRAAYFLDAGLVKVLVEHMQNGGEDAGSSFGTSRALVASLLGLAQMKHRLNRALLQQPRMAGRLFRDYYGFSAEHEARLLDPTFRSMSFEDTLRAVNGKAVSVVKSLLQGRADPNYQQSRQSKKTALHHCAEHGLTELAAMLLEARANPDSSSLPLERPPLHAAVVHRSAGVLQALLAARADTGRLDGGRRTALDVARMLRWVEGQALLGAGSLLAPLGVTPTFAAGELLPPGWRARLERGAIPGDSWSGASCELDVITTSELTPDRFLGEFLSLRRPALIRGGAAHMPAMERWRSLRYLARKAGDTLMSAVTIPYPEDFGDHDARDARRLTLEEYIDNVMGKVNSSSGTPLYVFSVVEQEQPAFKKMLMLVEKDAAPHPSWLTQDPNSKLKLRFGNIQFGLGPAGSGAPQHYHTHAYASLFGGRKRWWFYPPPRSALSRHHALRAAEADAELRSAIGPAPVGAEAAARAQLPLVCEQEPGDIVYVPTDWGHMTLNEGVSVSVSREFTWDGEETDSHVINSLQI